jgi:polyisoprenoid-binding protein YceI
MTDKTEPSRTRRRVPGRAPRRRHWWRWIVISAAILAGLVYGAAALIIKLPSVPPPLALPTAGASAPAGPLDGTWRVAAGSVAGFRVRETALGFSNDAVGRTSAVSGVLTVSGGRVTQATFRVDLTAVKINGKTQPQFGISLGTQAHPIATFTLSHPVPLGSAFASGATITSTAAGALAMNGVSRPATVTIGERRDGPVLRAAGSIPVQFSAWGIKAPAGYGVFGSLASDGIVEFSLILDRTGNTGLS